MRDAELRDPPAPPKSPATAPGAHNHAHNHAHNDAGDSGEMPRVMALRPTTREFSMRRLLNWASAGVAGVLIVALAIHWLPTILPGHTTQPQLGSSPSTQVRSHPASSTAFAPARGTGWQSGGPDWAQQIAFSADGALGYACGALGPGAAPVLFARYDAKQQVWEGASNPATGSDCEVSVSPVDASDVVLAVNYCPLSGASSSICHGTLLASKLYRSRDGGATWSQRHLPALMSIYGIAWTNSTLYLTVASDMAADSASIPSNALSHLLVSRAGGPLVEIGMLQMMGFAAPLSYILSVSNGRTLYIGVAPPACTSYCTVWLRTSDGGRRWARLATSHHGNPVVVAAAQPNTSTLIGREFLPNSTTVVPLRSPDGGMTWAALPPFPVNPSPSGAVFFALPDGSIYAACYGDANGVYRLPVGATQWQSLAPLPTGDPLAVQYDSAGGALALWGRALVPTSANGLEYYPLAPRG